MTDLDVSVGTAVAVGMWVVALLLEGSGTVVGLVTGIGAWTSIFMAWGIFIGVAAGTLTIKECTRKNRKVVAAAVRLMAQESSGDISRLPSR